MARGKVGLGRKGEELAAKALMRCGYHVITRNWYCPEGEVDIVAERETALTFFEVRTRRGRGCGTPEESVMPRKRARMEAVARRYLSEQPEPDLSWHLGFVAVQLDRQGRLQRITVYPDLLDDPLPVNFAASG